MATAPALHISSEEYLSTSFRPDCDWVDGAVLERTLGEQPHADVQRFLILALGNNAVLWNIRVFPEQRVQTSTEHFRVADVCVVDRRTPFERIVRTPPLLCVEILSRDDRMTEIQERLDDYLAMGVSVVWVIDPRRRTAYQGIEGATTAVFEALTVPGTSIEVSLPKLFAELDELEDTTRR